MRFTGALLAAAFYVSALINPAARADPQRVYIGTYTSGTSDGIYVLDFDSSAGAADNLRLAAKTENPSFLAKHPTLPVIYAVGEMVKEPDGPGGTVSAFRIEVSGALTLINRASSVGDGPCHVAVAPSGKHVAVANYGGGSTALLPIDDTGALGRASAFVQHEGSSVNPQRQEGPHAHSVTFDPSGKYLVVADLGLDKLLVYRYDAEKGALAPNERPAALKPGAGPRHTKFHPTLPYLYVVNELDSTVTTFAFDAASGAAKQIQNVGTLPGDFAEASTTAEIRVHPSGAFVYASNRGHDSISVFTVESASGTLSLKGHTPTAGSTPRNFNLDPSGKYLIAANQKSDTIVTFSIDQKTGALSPLGEPIVVPMPVCVLFL
ncbi:MAG: lactonase family protein [Candidatus Hydrogenedentes bacterium]|nr:lactonase family protein [Candidatus Hydrogenedentota bacterium]